MLRLIRHEWRHGGAILLPLFVLFSAAMIALPLSGSVSAVWAAWREGAALWVVLPAMSVALILWPLRSEILRTRNLLLLAAVRYVALSALIFLLVMLGDVARDSLASDLHGGAIVYDTFVRSQAALTLILLAWRFTSTKPTYAASLRPVLARAGMSAHRLRTVPFDSDERVKEYNRIQRGFGKAIDEVLKTVPHDDSLVHPWEADYLLELRNNAEEAKRLACQSSATLHSDIQNGGETRRIVEYWSNFK